MSCAYRYKREIDFEEYVSECQFQQDEKEFFLANGDQWCRFHLPMIDDDGVPTEKMRWPVDGIEESDFITEIHSRIDAAQELECWCDLSGIVFPMPPDFSDIGYVRPLGTVVFTDINFPNGTDFSYATIGD